MKSMESKKAIVILIRMLDKYSLSDEEKGAVLAAISVLDCAKLAEKRMEVMIRVKKAKRDKSLKW
jgi:hypothetical protein